MNINAKRIGYLRNGASFSSTGRKASNPPTKSMWRKLVKENLMIMDMVDGVELFRRSRLGDEALENFDGKLSESVRAVLNASKVQAPGIATMKGVMVAVEAGLLRYSDSSQCFVLTEAGKKLADPIGEEGFFTKSGNAVKVLEVSVTEGSEGMLRVERLQGDSAGKQMLIPRDSFVLKDVWNAELAQE